MRAVVDNNIWISALLNPDGPPGQVLAAYRRDDVLIETALVGDADVIVSRDEDLTRASEVADFLAPYGIRVLTVRWFLKALEEP